MENEMEAQTRSHDFWLLGWESVARGEQSPLESLALRVKVPNNHIRTQNLHQNC